MPDTTRILIEAVPPGDADWGAHARAVLAVTPPDRDADDATLAALHVGYPDAGLARSWVKAGLYPATTVWTAWRDADHRPADRAASSVFASPTPRVSAAQRRP